MNINEFSILSFSSIVIARATNSLEVRMATNQVENSKLFSLKQDVSIGSLFSVILFPSFSFVVISTEYLGQKHRFSRIAAYLVIYKEKQW